MVWITYYIASRIERRLGASRNWKSVSHDQFKLSTVTVTAGGILRDVCIQYSDSNWDIHSKRRLTNLTTHFIHNHCILLVQILPQLYLFFSALAVLACANLAIPLCTRGRVLQACCDNLLLWALQKHSLSSWRSLSAICSCWSCVYYWRRVRHRRAPAQSIVGLPFAGSNWRDDKEGQGEES